MWKPKIAIARICFGGYHHAAVGDWLARTCHVIVGDQRFGGLESFWVNRHNVCMARNLAVETAKERGCDFLVMVDSDMFPDVIPGQPQFWDSSIAHALGLTGPCIISAPCEKSDGDVVVYQDVEDHHDSRLVSVSRDFAASQVGIQQVPAISLALTLIDMRCFNVIPKPYFQFTYVDETESEMAYGEEFFTYQCSQLGIPVFCNWDAWCGHDKKLLRTRPKLQAPSDDQELWQPAEPANPAD